MNFTYTTIETMHDCYPLAVKFVKENIWQIYFSQHFGEKNLTNE